MGARQHRTISWAVVLATLTVCPALAQTTPAAADDGYADGVYVIDPAYLLSYPRNAWRILSAPARFDRSDWLTAAAVAGATGALLGLDEELREFWQEDIESGDTADVADVFRELGETENIVFGSLAAYALAEAVDSTGLFDARREKATALLVLESFLLTQGIVTGMKYLTGRDRPEDTNDAFDFDGPAEDDINAAFPSGHAGSAFALASVLSATYGDEHRWVPYLAYTLATGTALARVDDDRHWFSDTFVGGAIGYFVGQLVTRHSPFLERNRISLMPFNRDGVRGIGLASRF